MKTILEYLYNRKGAIISNKFGITKKDLIGELEGFPIGVVIRMLEEQEMQGNKLDITLFQKLIGADGSEGGFTWSETEAKQDFWEDVINADFDKFYKKYPEYKKYDI